MKLCFKIKISEKYFLWVLFLKKITAVRLLSIFHLKRLRNINVQLKCKKTRVPSRLIKRQ